MVSDLKEYIDRRKVNDPEFNAGYEEGYQAFKIRVLQENTYKELGLIQLQEQLFNKKLNNG